VNVESSPGVGTTFTLRFPLAGTATSVEAGQIETGQIHGAEVDAAPQTSNR
jgi:chemotaxis protein histidine kinase CheA